MRMGHELWAQMAGAWAYNAFSPFFIEENIGIPFESLVIGQMATLSGRIGKCEVLYFARATGDWNKAHMSPEGAAPFKKPIAHGLLVAGMFSKLIADKLPGPGSIYVSQTLNFLAPVYIGEVAIAIIEVVKLDPKKKRVTFKTEVYNTINALVLEGEAVVLAPN